jgi:hypothetical protein
MIRKEFTFIPQFEQQRGNVPIFDVPPVEYAVRIALDKPWSAVHVDGEKALRLVQLARCEACVELLLQPFCDVGDWRCWLADCITSTLKRMKDPDNA